MEILKLYYHLFLSIRKYMSITGDSKQQAGHGQLLCICRYLFLNPCILFLLLQLLYGFPDRLLQILSGNRLQHIMPDSECHCLLGIQKITVGRNYDQPASVKLSTVLSDLQPSLSRHHNI